MSDSSLPRRRGDKPRLPVVLTDDEWAQLDAHLNEVIPRFWQADALRWLRATYFSALLERTRRLGVQQYGHTIARLAGYPGYDDIETGRFVPVPPPEPELADFYTSAVNLVLESAGLYNAQRLEENRHYRVLVAHLLLWPDPIERAEDLPPVFYPLPLQFQQVLHNDQLYDDARVWVTAEPAARTQDLLRLVSKLQAAFDPPAEPLPYGSTHRKETRKERARRSGMSAQRRKLAEVVAELLEEQPLADEPVRSYADVLDNLRFKKARDQAQGALDRRINSVPALSGLMKQYSAETGWTHPRRRRS
jgi:hypothetical protein